MGDRAYIEAMKEFDSTYRVEADVMVCQHCQRRQQVAWRDHHFRHAAYCRGETAAPLPWLQIVSLIETSPKVDPDV